MSKTSETQNKNSATDGGGKEVEELHEKLAGQQATIQTLKERLVDSMEGEIQARRRLEALRDQVGQIMQAPPAQSEDGVEGEEETAKGSGGAENPASRDTARGPT